MVSLMCISRTCAIRASCMRHIASGTKPVPGQSFELFHPKGNGCPNFLKVDPELQNK